VRFVDAVRLSSQDPFGGSMQFTETLGYLYDGDAYVFSAIAHADQDGVPDFREALSRQDPYSEFERSHYEALPDSAKENVLAFETVLLHELTHQIDTLTTPVGALLHMWQVEEFIRLVPVLALLMADPDLDISEPIGRAIARPGHPIREALSASGHLTDIEDLLAETSQLRALDAVGPADVATGWRYPEGQVEGYVRLFNDIYEAVTVFGGTRTLRKPGARRPVTLRSVLETHALSNCVRHILWRFRGDPAVGAREVIRYLRCFYPPGLADDYRFVFDAVSRFSGFADFETALSELAETPVTSLDQIPVFAGLLAWAALHSGAPTERLVFLADYLRTRMEEGTPFDSPRDVLRHFDQETGLLPTAVEALELGRQAMREQRARILPAPERLADHFNSMLEAVERELTTRIDRGYGLGDPLGMPNEGNPARYQTSEQADLFGGSYRSDPAYARWRQLRTLLLARRCPSADKRDALAEWLSST
jgi:hypothetical protein